MLLSAQFGRFFKDISDRNRYFSTFSGIIRRQSAPFDNSVLCRIPRHKNTDCMYSPCGSEFFPVKRVLRLPCLTLSCVLYWKKNRGVLRICWRLYGDLSVVVLQQKGGTPFAFLCFRSNRLYPPYPSSQNIIMVFAFLSPSKTPVLMGNREI